MKRNLSDEWLRKIEPAIRDLLPEDYTPADQELMLRIGFQLKLLGVDWRTTEEFGQVMTELCASGIVLERRDPPFIEICRNPLRVFS